MQLINPVETYTSTEDGLVIANSQTLGADFWSDLDAAKTDFKMRLDGYTPVATIPAAVWDNWIRRGIDVYHLTAREIQALLRKEEMQTFILSGDKTF